MTTPKQRSKKQAKLSEFNSAVRMMRAIVKRIHKEIDTQRPDYFYAIVDSVNTQGNTVNVYYADDPDNTFKVFAGTRMPLAPGQQVRIAGRRGDKYIEDIPDGVTSDLPPGVCVVWPSATIPPGWLKCDGSTFDTTQYDNLATVIPSGTLPNYAAPAGGSTWIIKY